MAWQCHAWCTWAGKAVQHQGMVPRNTSISWDTDPALSPPHQVVDKFHVQVNFLTEVEPASPSKKCGLGRERPPPQRSQLPGPRGPQGSSSVAQNVNRVGPRLNRALGRALQNALSLSWHLGKQPKASPKALGTLKVIEVLTRSPLEVF